MGPPLGHYRPPKVEECDGTATRHSGLQVGSNHSLFQHDRTEKTANNRANGHKRKRNNRSAPPEVHNFHQEIHLAQTLMGQNLLPGKSYVNCTLNGCNIGSGSSLVNCTLNGCNGSSVTNMDNCTARGCNIFHSKAKHCQFQGCTLNDNHLTECSYTASMLKRGTVKGFGNTVHQTRVQSTRVEMVPECCLS